MSAANYSYSVPVPHSVASLIPTFDFTLFKASADFAIIGQAVLEGSLKGTGGSSKAELSAKIAFNVVVEESVQITHSFLCYIPYGVGNFLCEKRSLEVPLFGEPTIEVNVPIDLPHPSPIDFNVSIGPSAQIYAKSSLEINPHVFLKRESDPPPQDPGPLPSLSTSSGFGSDPSVYYRYFLDNGLVLAGKTGPDARIREFLPPNANFTL